jgi:hypothetical protein
MKNKNQNFKIDHISRKFKTVSQIAKELGLGDSVGRVKGGQRLRMHRLANQLRIIDVEDATGIKRSTIQRVEMGGNVELRTALILARFYETTVDDIWGKTI